MINNTETKYYIAMYHFSHLRIHPLNDMYNAIIMTIIIIIIIIIIILLLLLILLK